LQVLFFVFAKFLEWRKERCRFASSPGARSSRQRDECKKHEVVSGARAGLIDSQKIHKCVDEETERWTSEDIANEYIVIINLTSATCGAGEEW
jgi:hypothetical protein